MRRIFKTISLVAIAVTSLLWSYSGRLGHAHADNQVLGPFSSSANFTVDLLGPVDTRGDTWGRADYRLNHLKFSPPPGYHVHVLRVYGDFIAATHGAVVPGSTGYALFGLTTSTVGGSQRMSPAADGCFVYLQGAVTESQPLRAAFDFDVASGGRLPADNVMIVKMADFLNETGVPLHMEPSFVTVYQFELN